MKLMRIRDASRIFRAMQGDEWAQEVTSVNEVMNLTPAETFTEFLAVNQIEVYDQVARSPER